MANHIQPQRLHQNGASPERGGQSMLGDRNTSAKSYIYTCESFEGDIISVTIMACGKDLESLEEDL